MPRGASCPPSAAPSAQPREPDAHPRRGDHRVRLIEAAAKRCDTGQQIATSRFQALTASAGPGRFEPTALPGMTVASPLVRSRAG